MNCDALFALANDARPRAKPCACSDPCFVAFVADRIVEPCEHLKIPTAERVLIGQS